MVENEEGEEVDRDDKLDGHLFSEYLHELTVFELADTQVVLELLETLVRQGKVRNRFQAASLARPSTVPHFPFVVYQSVSLVNPNHATPRI